MKREFINFLNTTPDIAIRDYEDGFLFFNKKALGSIGYLLRKGQILRLPITLDVISK